MTPWHLLSFALGWLACAGALWARSWWLERRTEKRVHEFVARWVAVEEKMRGLSEAWDGAYGCECERCLGRRAQA